VPVSSIQPSQIIENKNPDDLTMSHHRISILNESSIPLSEECFPNTRFDDDPHLHRAHGKTGAPSKSPHYKVVEAPRAEPKFEYGNLNEAELLKAIEIMNLSQEVETVHQEESKKRIYTNTPVTEQHSKQGMRSNFDSLVQTLILQEAFDELSSDEESD
jgi:hypothetical protein